MRFVRFSIRFGKIRVAIAFASAIALDVAMIALLLVWPLSYHFAADVGFAALTNLTDGRGTSSRGSAYTLPGSVQFTAELATFDVRHAYFLVWPGTTNRWCRLHPLPRQGGTQLTPPRAWWPSVRVDPLSFSGRSIAVGVPIVWAIGVCAIAQTCRVFTALRRRTQRTKHAWRNVRLRPPRLARPLPRVRHDGAEFLC